MGPRYRAVVLDFAQGGQYPPMRKKWVAVFLGALALSIIPSVVQRGTATLPTSESSPAITPDFTVASQFPSMTVQQSTVNVGTSVAQNILLASVNGFAGTVSLSASFQPQGPNAMFSPAAVTLVSGGSGQSTIDVRSTIVGTFNITVTGTSSSLAHSIVISLTVTPVPPDFTVAVSPTSFHLQAGGSGTSTVTLTSIGGFAGTVSLCVGLDPQCVSTSTNGVTVSVSPSTVTLPTGGTATSTILVQTTSAATTGTYSVWVDATEGGVTHQALVSVGVGPYFTMTANPVVLSISAGSSGSSTLTLTSFANFSFNANFQVKVYLPGPLITCPPFCPIYPNVSTNPSMVPLAPFGTGAATLTVSTTSSTTLGTYTITVYGGGCVCLLPITSITLTVTSPPTGATMFSQTSTFQGITATTSGTLFVNSTAGTVTGSVSVVAVNTTTGAVVFSKVFSISLTFGVSNSIRFVLSIPALPVMLGVSCSVTVGPISTVSCLVSRSPDVNHDSMVNIIDIAMIAVSYGSSLGSSKYNPVVDLNADGTVNIIDIAMAAVDYGAPVFS